MRVFLTGATGWIGSAIVRELIDAGHSVVGLVRSKQNREALAACGGTPLSGSLRDLDVLRQAAGDADGVIHTAFGLDLAKIVELSKEDREAIETFGEVFAGSDRPIVVTGGFGLLPRGKTFTEDARPPVIAEFPRASEQTAFALAERGLRASVVRLPRSAHGVGERHGFVPMLAAIARDKGVSAYVEDGQNLWPAVHRLDAARVFRLALERGGRNEAFHAVAEGVPFRLIAEAIGRQFGLPAESLTPEQAATHFGGLAMWVAGNGPASSAETRAVLGWEPGEMGIISDIDRSEYYRTGLFSSVSPAT
ncbi:SDR family oxidoreductase [Rhodopila sp.]|uniref:SDR family oxidoreductase n=1 Tax=Rhodopila sp. TaxID=2480087 RepID=UPI003D0C3C9B